MTVLFFIMMAYQLTGNTVHEILGISLFALFIIHNILNLNWYKAIYKEKYTAVRVIRTAVNLLLLLSMLGMMVTALVISRTVFSFIDMIDIPFARELHFLFAYWGFILMAIHLGLHWVMIMGAARKMAKNSERTKAFAIGFRLAGIMIAVYGIYAFFKRQIGSYLILYNSYSFWDYEELAVFYFIDYLAIMGLCICITHYVIKRIQKTQKGRLESRRKQD
ncbi:DUF4405 domain-containing protein [Paenibacillus sophorae]|nr:DUF4405 domain-containing protein [Paenibacillus sophorae]QWU16724.1 DUF4405 domain-containing protein [Paenibacillus sophorae]